MALASILWLLCAAVSGVLLLRGGSRLNSEVRSRRCEEPQSEASYLTSILSPLIVALMRPAVYQVAGIISTLAALRTAHRRF